MISKTLINSHFILLLSVLITSQIIYSACSSNKEKSNEDGLEESQKMEFLRNELISKYRNVSEFSEGFFIVNQYTESFSDAKYGFVNSRGEEITLIKYSLVKPFKQGRAPICIGFYPNHKWGYINEIGEEVIPPKYNEVGNFSDGLAPALMNGKVGYLNRDGEVVIPFKFDKILDYYDDSYSMEFSEFKDGIAFIMQNDLLGLINTKGEIILKPMYTEFSRGCYCCEASGGFSDGLLAVRDVNSKWGFINKNGKLVILCTYDRVSDFSNGYAIVQRGGELVGEECAQFVGSKYGIIDKTGREVIPLKYDKICNFSDGLAPALMNGKVGYLNRDGEVVIPFKFDVMQYGDDYTDQFHSLHSSEFKDGIAFIMQNDLLGLINTKGEIILKPMYTEFSRPYRNCDPCGGFSDGLLAVRDVNSKWGFINKNGKLVILCTYDRVSDFSNGYAIVQRGGEDYHGSNGYVVQIWGEDYYGGELVGSKYGIIDKTGREVKPVIYAKIRRSDEGKYEVYEGGTKIIDERGFIRYEGGNWINLDL